MDFVRVKKRGQTQKHQKTWLSKDRQYQIRWARECFGVRVPPHYYALVNCLQNIDLGRRQWDFAGKRGPYKTFEAAVKACEKHEKVWLAAIRISEGERTGRNDRLRSLEFRARHQYIKDGKVVGQKIMTGIPVWVRNKANLVLLNYFFPRGRKRVEEDDECEDTTTSPSDLTPTSKPSDSLMVGTEPPLASGPASTVEAEAKSTPATTTPTKCAPSTGRARRAKSAPESAPAKRASKRMPKRSASGSAVSKPTKRTGRSSKAPVQS